MTTPTYGLPVSSLAGSVPTTTFSADTDLKPCIAIVKSFFESPKEPILTPDALWRDWLVVHDGVRTVSTAERIVNILSHLDPADRIHDVQVSPEVRHTPTTTGTWAVANITFKARRASLPLNCSALAFLTLTPSNEWKIFSITTILEDFIGHASPDDPARNLAGKTYGIPTGDTGALTYDAVIIGGGQHGLSTAGRLGALGLRYLVIEKDDEIGDSWGKRYESVRMHTPREYANLPFERTWTAEDDQWLSGKRVKWGHQNYVNKFNINVWTKSTIEKATRNEKAENWTLRVNRNGQVGDIVTRHLLFATGSHLGHPKRPTIAGEADFKGEVLHSKDYFSAKGWKGKRGVIFGSNTSAMDIAKDMVDAGLAEVHLIQRSPSGLLILKVLEPIYTSFYNREMPLAVVDRLAAMPIKHCIHIFDETMLETHRHGAPKKFLDDVESKGFKIDRKAAIFNKIYETGGTFYAELGAGQYIIDGKIKVKSGVPPSHYTPSSLVFADGSALDPDVVVYATGWKNDYNEYVGSFVGKDISDRLAPWWGLNEEGECSGVMQNHYPGLWLMGGEWRWNPRAVALQIQLDMIQAEKKAWEKSLQAVNSGEANGSANGNA